ncbi:Conserved_hypothetical protein [Hexamita inflata]|uniref:Uncharacterized protein n=1 Tax=Hexamita inflata TaxID=28002 RepID=A0AA86NFA0_9EUKA|nr:Conserved hypothetical protein [Hexamita inflata]CAI9918647.1 Conserved hypothetical protein [Hexamita inflata]
MIKNIYLDKSYYKSFDSQYSDKQLSYHDLKVSSFCVLDNNIQYLKSTVSQFLNTDYSNQQQYIIYKSNSNAIRYFHYHLFIQHVKNRIKIIPVFKDYGVIQIENLFIVKVDENATDEEIMNTILNLSDAEYFCSWSSTAFHDASRVSLQMTQMEQDNTNVSVLKQVPTYHYEDGSVTLNEDTEQQLETILFRRQCLENISQYSSIKDLALQIARQNAVSYVSSATAYLDLSDKYKKSKEVLDDSASKYLVNLAKPKQRFDAVISLGAWCQVSLMAEWRQLYSVQSPFIGFGFFQWERLLDVLESNFSNYWEKENMGFGKATPFFSFKYNDERRIHHVYDNHYNMFSCHHFDECDCTVDRLAPYQQFKIDLNRRIDNFRQQCLSNRSVLFNLKIFNKNVSSTTISESQLLRLVKILNQFRNGSYFELRISVPPFLFEETARIIRSNNLNIKAIPWTEEWNQDPYEKEWSFMYDDVTLSYRQN